MTHTIALTPVALDASAFLAECKRTAKISASNSGGSFEVYEENLSYSLGLLIAQLPQDQREAATALARERYDLKTKEEIKQLKAQSLSQGYCAHGFEYRCCSLGCGEH